MPRGRTSKVKVAPSFKRRSPFDFENIGIQRSPGKSYRWVRKDRLEERKNSDGYQFTKPPLNTSTQSMLEGASTSEKTIRVKGMYLMERPKDISMRRKKEKEALTRHQSSGVREQMARDTERLSHKYGVDLHKYVTREKGNN